MPKKSNRQQQILKNVNQFKVVSEEKMEYEEENEKTSNDNDYNPIY